MPSLRYFLLAATICLAVAVVADAQSYGRYGTYGGSGHHYPYAHAHKIVVAETLVVPVVVPGTAFINVAAPAYPAAVTISPSLFQQTQQQAQTKDAALQKRLDALDAKLNLLLAPAQQADRAGPPKLRLPPQSAQKVSLQQVAAIFDQHCASCHTGANSEKGVAIFNDRGEYEPSVSVNRLIDAALDGRMPKGPNKVGEDQKRVLGLFKGAS